MAAKIITFGTKKGGAGKTTISHGIAAAAGKAGWRVLLADVDSQAPTIRAIAHHGKFAKSDLFGAMTALANGNPTYNYFDAVAKDVWENVDILTANHDSISAASTNFSAGGTYGMGGVRVFGRLLDIYKDHYDLIVIDTPPELSGFTEFALIASDYAISVSRANQFEIPPALNFVAQIENLRESLGALKVEHLGLVINSYDPKAAEGRDQLKMIAVTHGNMPVFTTAIPTSKRTSKAYFEEETPASTLYENAPVAKSMRQLFNEIFLHIGQHSTPPTAFTQYDSEEIRELIEIVFEERADSVLTSYLHPSQKELA